MWSIVFNVTSTCCPLSLVPLEKGPGRIKAVIILLWLEKRAGIVRNDYQLLLIQKTTPFNLSSTGVVSFQTIQLLKKEKNKHLIKHEMWEENTPNYLSFFFYWTSIHPPKSLIQDLSPCLRNFYFGSAIRHESKFVHRYTPARKEEL